MARAGQHTYGLCRADKQWQLQQQIWAYQFPEKLIPRSIIAALNGRPVELYGTSGRERPRLAAMSRITADACGW